MEKKQNAHSEKFRLSEGEDRFRALLNNAPVGIVRTTPEGKIIYANKAIAAIFDYDTPESMISQVEDIARDIYHSYEARAAILNTLLQSGSYKGNITLSTRSGKTRIINLIANATFNSSGKIEWIDSTIEDITEKVRLEMSLKQREAILTSIINSLPFELWVSDRQGNVLCQSAHSRQYLGDLTGKNIAGMETDWNEKSRQVLNGEIIDKEKKVVQDGKEFYYHRIMGPLLEDNRIEGVISLSVNITGKKLAEQKLKKSEEQYRYLMENMNEVLMQVDNNDIVQYVNPRFTEKLGYAPEEIIGKTGYEVLLEPEDYHVIIDANKKREQKIASQYEVCFRAKDGRRIDFLVNGAPIYDDHGNTIGSIGTMTDITEMKKAEKLMRKSEKLLRNIFDLAPYPISLNTMDGKYLMINKAFTRDTGFEPDEIVGKTSEEAGLMIDKEGLEKIMAEMPKSGKIENFDMRLTGKNGQTSDVLYSGKIMIIDNEPVILSSSVDITEKKLIQQELEVHRNNLEIMVKERTEEIMVLNEELTATNEELYQNNEELNSLNEALAIQKKQLEEAINSLRTTQMHLVQSEKMASIGVLTAGIAHEINNPVNFISSGITGLEILIADFLKIIEQYTLHCEDIENCRRREIKEQIEEKYHFKSSVDNIQRLFQSIRIGVERTTNIVKSLRTFSRLDREIKSYTNIHELIDSSLTILNNKIKDRIHVEKEYLLEEPVNCFPGKLSQVFMNLLINAIQAIENQGTIRIITRKLKGKNKFEVIVGDTGKGMTRDVQMKIFDPFFTTKPVGEGTGMGLSIVHGIIKDHNGEIIVTSEPGLGTEFRIVLPVN